MLSRIAPPLRCVCAAANFALEKHYPTIHARSRTECEGAGQDYLSIDFAQKNPMLLLSRTLVSDSVVR